MQLELVWEPDQGTPQPAVHALPPPKWTEASLGAELERRTGLRVRLKVTDNTSSVMSVRHHRLEKSAAVRLHHMFLGADAAIVAALATWVKQPGRRSANGTLDSFIRANRRSIRARAVSTTGAVTRGIHFELQDLFDQVNREQFHGRVKARITWGRMPTARRRRSIRFGSYLAEENLIRIHPLLDQGFVPEYFVRYIVFHEMLHAHLGIATSASGRRYVHSRAFRQREEVYPDYARAVAWQDNPSHLRKLLRY